MPIYNYKAIDSAGASRSGQVEAMSRVLALDVLHKRGLVPITVGERGASNPGAGFRERLNALFNALRSQGRVEFRQIVSLTHSLAALLKAGLTIDRALAISASLETDKSARLFLEDLAKSVRAGKTFSESLGMSRTKLPTYFASMVEAGEAGGSLPQTLARVAVLSRKQLETKERIRSALVYPAVLACMVLVTLIILLGFVLPRFRTMFSESEAPLPWSTRVVLAIGDFTANYWWLIAMVVLSAVFGFWSFVRTDAGKERVDRFLLHSRWTFGLPAALDTARLLRTLSTLVQNGVPLPTALRIGEGTMTNGYLRKALHHVTQRVKAGESFSVALADVSVFPNQAVQLARVGEETGHLDELLLEAADILDGESQTSLDRLLTLLVPALTIGMGCVIAALIGSVLIGLLSINDLAY